jgi:DNA-binding CsgD family transcriptional regulator
LDELALACGAEGAIAMPVCGLRPLGPVFSPRAAEFFDDFIHRWQAPELNTRMERSMALVKRGWRGVLTQQDCYSLKELARDPFHQEYVVPHGLFAYAGGVIAEMPGFSLPISLERRNEQGFFLRDEVELMNKLFAHLASAGDLAVRIGLASSARLSDVLSATGQPLALIGHDGRVVHMNVRFERLLGDGIRIRDGRLGATVTVADRALRTAIARAIGFDGAVGEPIASVVLPRSEGLRPLVAQAVPVVGRAHDVLRFVAAIVTLTDLEADGSVPAAALLEQAFGLTPAEARLAAQIAAGKTLAEIARNGCSGRETLRTQLKAVFDKTGTSRQAELALLLSRIPSRR